MELSDPPSCQSSRGTSVAGEQVRNKGHFRDHVRCMYTKAAMPSSVLLCTAAQRPPQAASCYADAT